MIKPTIIINIVDCVIIQMLKADKEFNGFS